MISRVYSKNNIRKKPNKSLVFIFICMIIPIVYYNICIKPNILSTIIYEGKIIATHILSQAVVEALSLEQVEYDELMQVKTDNDGKISAISANSVAINRINSHLAGQITELINSGERVPYKLPIGTLLGSEILIGRGPDLTIDVKPMGYAKTSIETELTQAGINQICHKLYLKVQLNFTTIVPMNRSDLTITQDFLISETIIVGEIPQYYTSIDGASGKNANDITSNLLDGKYQKNTY